MSTPIVYVDRSRVREGKRDALVRAMQELARFVEEREPRIVGFHAFLSEDGTRMTVVHVHPDAASLDTHLRVAGPRFAPFAELIELSSIEVYGRPSDWAVERLHEKVARLGRGTVELHRHLAGFVRSTVA